MLFSQDVKPLEVANVAAIDCTGGVDVRVLVPEQYDNFVVGLTTYSYLNDLEKPAATSREAAAIGRDSAAAIGLGSEAEAITGTK